jgi:hypothetical protein
MGSGTRLRLVARCRRNALDERLAQGHEPSADPVLALRADQLCSRRSRAVLADTIVGIVDMAYERPLPAESPRLDRDAIVASETWLLDLAGRLRRDPEVSPLAVARARKLVDDKTGPLYSSELPGRSLRNEVRAALAALDLAA